MKTALSALLLLTSTALPALATTIAQWTFETSIPTTAGPLAAEVGFGTATAFHTSTVTAYTNPVGNGSPESWSSDRWAVGDYYQFQVSTSGYQDITLSWDQTSSNTGPRDFALLYSTDGTIFTLFADYSVLANASPNPAWSSGTTQAIFGLAFNLSAITALDNDADVYFRLRDRSTVSANGGTVATGGTDRVDNFTVSGTPIPSPVPETSPGMVGLAGVLVLMAAFRHRWSQ